MPRWPLSRRRETTAFLGLGSNVGDRLAHVRDALADLDAHPAVAVEAVSSVYETQPWTTAEADVPAAEQPPYLNAVVCVTTTLRPRELLALAHDTEAHHGRDRAREGRYGPRTLDVDLLLYDDEVIDEPDLTVPHPRLHERAFVLVPLAEVLPPGARLPDGTSVTSLLARLAPIEGVSFHVRLTEGPGSASDPMQQRPAGPRAGPPRLGERWRDGA